MSAVHVIRLRGPWEYEPSERTGPGELPPSGREQTPCDWLAILGEDFRGGVRFRRYFNRPGQLDADERLWLVIDEADPILSVALNAQPLVASSPQTTSHEYDITPQLATRNELMIDVVRTGETLRGWLGEVRLEIRRISFQG